MNPHAEAWRAAKQQQEGQNEGQIAGATLVMINSLGSQIKDQYADQKQTFTDFNSSLLVTNEELKNVQKVIHEGIQKTLKSGQDQMREVGIEVKTQIGEACQRVGDYIPEFRQVGEQIYQNIAPVGDHVAELNKILAAVDFVKIEELPKSIVRLEKRTEDVKKDIQNTQATSLNWKKIIFGLLGVFVACVAAFFVAFFFYSVVDTKLLRENSSLQDEILDLKEKNGQWQLAFNKQKAMLDDAQKEIAFSQSFELWLVHGDEARLRDFKFTYQSELNKNK